MRWPFSMGKLPVVASMTIVALAVMWTASTLRRLEVRARTVEVAISREVADSLALDSMLSEFHSLEARRDSIARRVDVARSIGGRRYVWPRLLSEISDAMPSHAWLLEVVATERPDSADPGPGFLIQGRAGSSDALTTLLKNLEDSDYIRGVTLIATEQERFEGRIVQRFSLEAGYDGRESFALHQRTLSTDD